MAIATECQTPGAEYGTHITPDTIEAWVEFPVRLTLTEKDAEVIEANIHNALELVLAPYFRSARVPS